MFWVWGLGVNVRIIRSFRLNYLLLHLPAYYDRCCWLNWHGFRWLPFSVFAAYLRSLLNSNFLVLQLFFLSFRIVLVRVGLRLQLVRDLCLLSIDTDATLGCRAVFAHAQILCLVHGLGLALAGVGVKVGFSGGVQILAVCTCLALHRLPAGPRLLFLCSV